MPSTLWIPWIHRGWTPALIHTHNVCVCVCVCAQGVCVCVCVCVCLKKVRVLVSQLCPTFCDPMDYSLPGSSVHGILQARILKWIAILFSRRSSSPRDQIQNSCIAGKILYHLSHQRSPYMCVCVCVCVCVCMCVYSD